MDGGHGWWLCFSSWLSCFLLVYCLFHPLMVHDQPNLSLITQVSVQDKSWSSTINLWLFLSDFGDTIRARFSRHRKNHFLHARVYDTVNGSSSFQVSRLPLCGDVASNPGPWKQATPKFPCKECGKGVRSNQDASLFPNANAGPNPIVFTCLKPVFFTTWRIQTSIGHAHSKTPTGKSNLHQIVRSVRWLPSLCLIHSLSLSWSAGLCILHPACQWAVSWFIQYSILFHMTAKPKGLVWHECKLWPFESLNVVRMRWLLWGECSYFELPVNSYWKSVIQRGAVLSTR